MKTSSKIYLAGHTGTVGSAVMRNLIAKGYHNIIYATSSELDLRQQQSVEDFFALHQPEYVIDAAAIVGGILANNNFPYQFLVDNLLIQTNLMNASLRHHAEKFIFLGSSCVYPKLSPQPIKESYLLSSELEPTNEWYAIAKIAGIKLCEAIRKQFGNNFVSLMPTNTYGPNDNFDLQTAHVLPSMIRKFHEAKLNNHAPVLLWGNGTAKREFIFVDDLADGVVFACNHPLKESMYNIGTGIDLSIRELSLLIQQIVGHQGPILWDETKPNGTPRKVLDVSKIGNEGWVAKTSLEAGLQKTYEWFQLHQHQLRETKIG